MELERRRVPRRIPGRGEPLSRLRMRTGGDLDVLDISDVGAQVEGSPRLLPGTRVDVHVVTPDGRVLVRGRVLRSYVCHLEAHLVRYRSALTFEVPVDTGISGYQLPNVFEQATESQGIVYPGAPDPQFREKGIALPRRELPARFQPGIAFG